MKKVIIEGFIGVSLFVILVLTLQRIDWLTLVNYRENVDKTERKIGEVLWGAIKTSNPEVSDIVVVETMDSLLTRLCEANSIDRSTIKLHVVENDEVNAFALPDGHLIVNRGLITKVKRQEELIGVMGHEIAHIQLNHVMKKLVKEIGLSAIVSMTAGNSGGRVISEAIGSLSSSSFDRAMEKQADIQSVDYMVAARIDPAPFADFMYLLASESAPGAEYLQWISTHPESKERAAYIIAYGKSKVKNPEPVLNEYTWKKLRERLNKAG